LKYWECVPAQEGGRLRKGEKKGKGKSARVKKRESFERRSHEREKRAS